MIVFKLNVKKAVYLPTGVNESIRINGSELLRASVFMYLGLAIASDGSLMVEVNSSVSEAWPKCWLLTEVLSYKKMPERLKERFYRTVVRRVAKYGAECWPATKEAEAVFQCPCVCDKMLR